MLTEVTATVDFKQASNLLITIPFLIKFQCTITDQSQMAKTISVSCRGSGRVADQNQKAKAMLFASCIGSAGFQQLKPNS
jgi:hypothetical protein